jgi:GNAT superfamily N-acetyltransferase
MIKLKQLFYEVINEEDLLVISTNQNVSVSYRPVGEFRASTVGIDNTGRGFWWVARSLVSNAKLRGKGIGSALLTRAIKEVLKHEPNAKIIVEPAGTYGSDEERQLNFYRKNGFVDVPKKPGVLMYNNQKLSEAFHTWTTPENTPDEVINAIHNIIKVIERDAPKESSVDWFHISFENGIWYISKPKMKGERHWILGFNEQTKQWKIYYIKDNVIHKSGELKNNSAVNFMIGSWVKGL